MNSGKNSALPDGKVIEFRIKQVREHRVAGLSWNKISVVVEKWKSSNSASHEYEGSVSMSPDSSCKIIAEVFE